MIDNNFVEDYNPKVAVIYKFVIVCLNKDGVLSSLQISYDKTCNRRIITWELYHGSV